MKFENGNRAFPTRFGEVQTIHGKDGTDGTNGASAYEIAVKNGFQGTESEWLASLKGEPGKAAVKSVNGVKPDENGNVQVQGGGSEGVYELIETITLDDEMAVSRTQEPDGTPYAFVDIFLKIKVLNAALPDVVRFIFYYNGIAVARTYLSPQASTGNYYASCIVKMENGYWRSGWDVWQTNSSIVNSLRTSNDIEYALKYAADSYPCVNWINAGVLPAGTTIEIYGVRA